MEKVCFAYNSRQADLEPVQTLNNPKFRSSTGRKGRNQSFYWLVAALLAAGLIWMWWGQQKGTKTDSEKGRKGQDNSGHSLKCPSRDPLSRSRLCLPRDPSKPPASKPAVTNPTPIVVTPIPETPVEKVVDKCSPTHPTTPLEQNSGCSACAGAGRDIPRFNRWSRRFPNARCLEGLPTKSRSADHWRVGYRDGIAFAGSRGRF